MRGERARDLAALALLTLAVVAFFWPLILTQAWIPRGGGDLVSFLWPMYRFAARSLRSATVPLWNPHLHSGAPFVADNQSGLFYPVNLIAFALLGPPSYRAMEGLVVFHIWLAAAGTFVLLRGLRLRRSAAVLGALAFALSDLFITHVGNLNLNATAAWLPIALWATHRALVKRSPFWAASAGAVVAVAALAGHAQMLLFLALALALYVVSHVASIAAASADAAAGAAGDRRWQRAGQTLGLTLLIAVVGLGGAALMLLPAWQLAGHSGRGHLPYQEATRYSLPPRALIGLIAPGFYGRGPANFWAPWERVEVGYAGVATLLLAALGVGLLIARLTSPAPPSRSSHGSRGRPSNRVPFATFALLIPLALLLAMGRHTPLYRLLYRFVPTFDQIRAPARLILLADLGLAVMAAYALHHLMERPASRGSWRTWVALGAAAAALLLVVLGLPQARSLPPPDRVAQAARSLVIAAVLLALSGALIALAPRLAGRPWAEWLLPLLLAVDLIGLGSTLEIERHDPTAGFHHPEVVAFLEQDASLFRIEGGAPAWQPDAALVHGLYDIGGLYNPLGLAPYQAYRWAVGERGSPLYNLLGAKYVLAGKENPPGDERLVPVHATSQIDVYLNTAALPRALFVTERQLVSDHEEAWHAIHAPSFSPTRTVVLEQELEQDLAPAPPRRADAPEASRLEFVRYGLNAVELRVESPVSGWLVLSDVYYPGWRATLDGRPTPLLRANYTFRAVQVPAGDHAVEMRFAPRTWYLGLALTIATWLAVTAATIHQIRRTKR
jgi:hypothetical protein